MPWYFWKPFSVGGAAEESEEEIGEGTGGGGCLRLGIDSLRDDHVQDDSHADTGNDHDHQAGKSPIA